MADYTELRPGCQEHPSRDLQRTTRRIADRHRPVRMSGSTDHFQLSPAQRVIRVVDSNFRTYGFMSGSVGTPTSMPWPGRERKLNFVDTLRLGP
ncbi:MAG: hypothetical protein ACE5M4_15490, partial [Anaerolineales bacterium]